MLWRCFLPLVFFTHAIPLELNHAGSAMMVYFVLHFEILDVFGYCE